MPVFNVNLGDVDINDDFLLLPVGVYVLEVVNIEEKISNTSGNSYLQCRFKPIADADGEPLVDDNGEALRYGLIFENLFHNSTEDFPLKRLKSFLLAAGVTEEDLAEGQVDTDDFLPAGDQPGAQFYAVVHHESDPNYRDGEAQVKVKKYLVEDDDAAEDDNAAEDDDAPAEDPMDISDQE